MEFRDKADALRASLARKEFDYRFGGIGLSSFTGSGVL
jgi:hypothetical protein